MLTMWNEAINHLSLHLLPFVKLHCFIGVYILYFTYKKDTLFQEIDDIGEEAEDDVPDNSITLSHVRVVAATLSFYSACLSCGNRLSRLAI